MALSGGHKHSPRGRHIALLSASAHAHTHVRVYIRTHRTHNDWWVNECRTKLWTSDSTLLLFVRDTTRTRIVLHACGRPMCRVCSWNLSTSMSLRYLHVLCMLVRVSSTWFVHCLDLPPTPPHSTSQRTLLDDWAVNQASGSARSRAMPSLDPLTGLCWRNARSSHPSYHEWSVDGEGRNGRGMVIN